MAIASSLCIISSGSGALIRWEFERDGDKATIDPSGPLLVQVGGAVDLAVDVAVAGTGIVYLFEDWRRPYIDQGLLEPVLQSLWPRFSSPFLYYPGRRLLPAPLRAFVSFIRNDAAQPTVAPSYPVRFYKRSI